MAQPGTITAVLLDADGEDREIDPLEDFASIPDQQIYWLILTGSQVPASVALPPDWSFAERLHGVRVSEQNFGICVPAAPKASGNSDDRIELVVGRNWLVTLSEAPLPLTRRYLDEDTGLTLKGSLTAPALAVSLLLTHFGDIHAQLAAIDEKLDALDEQVFRARRRHDPLVTLAVLRRQTARIRSVVAQHRPVIEALDRPDFGPTVCAEDREHLGHLADAYHRLVETVERTRDAVLGSYDLYATRLSQNTNRLLERLTVITIGIGLIGAIAGIFGMNFEVRLFREGEQSFWAVVIVMAALAVVTLSIAMFRRWQE